jgi:predicted ATPase
VGLFIADGIEALDVTLFGGPPVDAVRVDLQHGLTVLYGANGAGKTTVLDGVASAFTGVRRPHGGEAYLRCRLVRHHSLYDMTMLLGIAELARRAAMADTPTEDHDAEAQLHWDDAWTYWQDPPEERFTPGEDDQHHDTIVDQLLDDIQQLGGKTSPADDLNLMLVSAGSPDKPEWLVYVSRTFDESRFPPDIRNAHLAKLLTDETISFAVLDLDRFGASGFGTWTLRTRYIGRLAATGATRVIRSNDRFAPSATTLARLEQVLEIGHEPLIEHCDSETFQLGEFAEEKLDRMAADATSFFRRMVDTDSALKFSVRHPSAWATWGFGEWKVEERNGVRIPVERQGSAHQRWAKFAIEMSMFSGRHDWPVVLLLDEPESALHPAAQAHLVRGLAFDDDFNELPGNLMTYFILAATHSPAILNAANANMIHVHRESGRVRLDPIRGMSHVDELVDRLGVTRADALLMTKCFVLVEGEHDELVLRGLLGDELDRRRARIVTMRGAKKVAATLDIEVLAQYSDARLLLVIDRLGKRGSDCWKDAQGEFAKKDLDASARALHRLERLPGGEGQWLAEAGLAAMKAGKLDQIGLVGLERRDILEYLPVDAFVPGATSWKALRDEHARSGERGDFKDWLRSRKGARISRASILNAIGRVDDLGDLPRVLTEI